MQKETEPFSENPDADFENGLWDALVEICL